MNSNNCYDLLRPPKKNGGIFYEVGTEERILKHCKKLGLTIKDFTIEISEYQQYMINSRYMENYSTYYSFNLSEKSLEHFIAAKLLKLNKNDIYIDIASEHSPVPEIYHKLFDVKTYKQDLAYPEGLNDDMIGGNAANMPVPNGFATKLGFIVLLNTLKRIQIFILFVRRRGYYKPMAPFVLCLFIYLKSMLFKQIQ